MLETQLLSSIQTLEKKAEQESQTIQSLNERIAQLEQKIAAINATVLAHHESEHSETIQVVVNANEPNTTHTTPAQPGRIIVGSATTHIDNPTADTFFNIKNTWQNTASSNHLVSASGGLLIILFGLVMWRTYRIRSTQSPSSPEKETINSAATDSNPITSNEKNALVAQKLAALRNAVKQGKQRQQHKE